MNFKQLFLLAFVAFFLLFPISLAQNVEVAVFPTELRIKAESTQTMELTMKNNLNQDSTFLISIFPTSLTGIIIIPEKNSVYLLPRETKTIQISFVASVDVLERVPQSLQITVSSIDFPNVSDSINVLVISERTVAVSISSLSIDKTITNPDSMILISLGITNYASSPSDQYILQTTIMKERRVIKTYEEQIRSIPARSTTNYNYTYYFDRYASAGGYVVSSELRDGMNKIVSSITPKDVKVNEISNKITIDKSSSYGFLYSSIIVKIKNEGNVPVTNFNFTESLPSFAVSFFAPETEPKYVSAEDGRTIYKWSIASLSPGEEVMIKYSFRLWHVWAGLIGIGIIVYLFFKFTFMPTVIKSHSHIGPITKDKEILIKLDVRNNTLREIRDVVVKDTVPTIAKVVERFETMKPVIKIGSYGTELTWKFDSLKPREERILTYRIKPNLNIAGSLHLPSATIKYMEKNREKKESISKRLEIKGK